MSDLSDLFAHIKLVIPSYLSQAWFEQTDKLHNSFINWSQVSNFHFFNQYFRWSKLPTMTPESQKTLITSCWDFTYQLWYWVQLSTSSCYAQFFPPKSYGLNQGNLSRGIDNKILRNHPFKTSANFHNFWPLPPSHSDLKCWTTFKATKTKKANEGQQRPAKSKTSKFLCYYHYSM